MEVVLDCEYEGRGTDPWGKTRAGFTFRTELDRQDWGLRWNQALETGGVPLRLRRAEIVKSTRGARGGYSLASSPEEITVRDVIQASELETFDLARFAPSEIGPGEMRAQVRQLKDLLKKIERTRVTDDVRGAA